MRSIPYLIAFVLSLCVSPGRVRADTESAAIKIVPADLAFFENKVRPLLLKRCHECHSQAEKIKGGLALDSRAGWMAGGDSGSVIAPGDPENSLLIHAIEYRDEEYEMPPKGKLPDAEIAVLREWIRRGAPDPRGGEVLKDNIIDIEEGRKHWSFQPISRPRAPEVKNAEWSQTEIDRFLYDRLQQAGIEPVVSADRFTLLRRLYFTLIGLPPTPEAIEAFVRDDRPDAVGRVVDELVETRQFAERWGRHWLDLARYADTNGLDENFTYFNAWRYRNYVIDAIHEDKPFNDFIREQIAGDLLGRDQPDRRDELTVATGFLAIGPLGISEADKELLTLDKADEQLITIGRTFLGLELGCVRCHDHKFDPIPRRDYYAMAGILTSTQSDGGALRPNSSLSDWLRVPLGDTSEEDAKGSRKWYPDLHKAEEKRNEAREEIAEIRAKLAALESQGSDEKEAKELREELEEEREELQEQEKKIAELKKKIARFPVALAVKEKAKPGDESIRLRGEASLLGDSVPRGFLQVVRCGDEPAIPADESGRRELAEWLVSPRHPLTTRVFVNRVWAKVFGEGIVRTVDDFGTQGAAPSHPELLDYLATRFQESGWSLKTLVREMVFSRAFRSSSSFSDEAHAIDPENRLFWRMNNRRLEPEAIRDAILAIRGDLDLAPREMTMEGIGSQATGIGMDPLPEFDTNYRTIYLPVFRNALPGILGVFDFADPQVTTGKRPVTTVAPQALYLMNSDFVIESAAMTEKTLHGSFSDKIEEAFLRIFNRPPTEAETNLAVGYLSGDRNLTNFLHGLFTSTPFQFLE